MSEANENALALTSGGDIMLPELPMSLEALAPELVDSGNFLPFMILAQGQSPAMQPPNDIKQGHFAIRTARDQYTDLGTEVDVYILHRRIKAMIFDRGANKVTTNYDHTTEEFKEIAAKANDKVLGYSWGFEYLLYLPEHNLFLTLFCSTKSGRISAQKALEGNMRKKITVFSHQAKGATYTFLAFLSRPCSVPDTHPIDMEKVARLTNDFIAGNLEVASEELPDAPAAAGEDRAR